MSEATKEFLQSVFADDVAQKLHLGRAAVAEGYGLDPTIWTRPFPGSSTTVNYQVTAPTSSSKLKTVAAGVVGAGALGFAGWLGALLANLPDAAPTSPQQITSPVAPVPVPAPAAAEAGARVRVFWGDQEITPDRPAAADVEVGAK